MISPSVSRLSWNVETTIGIVRLLTLIVRMIRSRSRKIPIPVRWMLLLSAVRGWLINSGCREIPISLGLSWLSSLPRRVWILILNDLPGRWVI
jgi:hypothetical protein